MTMRALVDALPNGGPPHLYNLVSLYPLRPGKGLRSSLCLTACGALGGSAQQALNSAVALELFHNAFLIYDDIQDGSLARRGGPTLHRSYGIGTAINIGNVTNLLGLERLLKNRAVLGPDTSWAIAGETVRMMRCSLEGQALELAWIQDNTCDLKPDDYLRMCMKKTSWYSFIYPLRVGAMVAGRSADVVHRLCRLGSYVGAAFQIQDDILNLTGDYKLYGKEIGGDLREGKRTLMLVHLLNVCSATERIALERLLAGSPAKRDVAKINWLLRLMDKYRCIEFARRTAQYLSGAALLEAVSVFGAEPDSEYKEFVLGLVCYVVGRDR